MSQPHHHSTTSPRCASEPANASEEPASHSPHDNANHEEDQEEDHHSNASSHSSSHTPLFEGIEFVIAKETVEQADYDFVAKLIQEHGGILAESISDNTVYLLSGKPVWPVPPHVLSLDIWFVEDGVNSGLLNEEVYLWNLELSHQGPQLKKRKLMLKDDDDKNDMEQERKTHTSLEQQMRMANSSMMIESLLSVELWYEIFMFLEIAELNMLSLVSWEMHRLVQDDRYEKNQSFWIRYYNQFIQKLISQSENEFFNSIHNTSFDKYEPKTNLNRNKKRLLLTTQKATLLFNRRASPRLGPTEMPHFSLPNLVKNRTMIHLHFLKALKRRKTVRITCEASSKKGNHLEQVQKYSQTMTLFQGLSIKDQLEALKSRVNEFTEINFGPFHEYDMNGEIPKVYLDWISENSALLNNIRSLFFLDVHYTFCEVSWMRLGDLKMVLEAFSNLVHWTSLGSQQFRFSSTHASSTALRSLVLISAGLSKPILEDVFYMKLPNLCHLELFLGDDNRRDRRHDFEPEFIQNLLTSTRCQDIFPSLDYLGLRNYEHIDQVTLTIFESPFSKRVRILDLSLGTLSDEGVKGFLEILKNEERMNHEFLNLEILDVHNSYLSQEMVEELLNVTTLIVNTTPHKNASHQWRYVTLNE
ncbi:hypothetical protein C9374_014112 [Naegleria lovaniensis]|uniref:BRCT domain-containing protein n=1 Tax=Naegleria lovaniensis TaxID=51637 RepID=A0AA88GYR0_NAELO|nr:uncharacterized protein C9374_014112 [Naegleria lovaniensis]KAG2389552.1 hypothetical protein C9374_014112 [Naegleria lovaniensis]